MVTRYLTNYIGKTSTVHPREAISAQNKAHTVISTFTRMAGPTQSTRRELCQELHLDLDHHLQCFAALIMQNLLIHKVQPRKQGKHLHSMAIQNHGSEEYNLQLHSRNVAAVVNLDCEHLFTTYISVETKLSFNDSFVFTSQVY
jgi:hypothetical protein